MLTSNRLRLSAVEPSDADFMYEVENDCCAWRYSDTVAPLSHKLLLDYALTYDADPFSAQQLRLIVREKGRDIPVGIVDLYELSQRHSRAFIGIYICKEYRKKGYADEALQLMEEYAFNSLHLHQLGAKIEDGNTNAEKLFRKRSFELKGCLDDWLSQPDGKYSQMKIYTKILA